MHEPEDPAPVTGDGQHAPPQHAGVHAVSGEVGARPVKGAVAQHDAVDAGITERGRLEGGDRTYQFADLAAGVRPERIGFGAHTGTGPVGERDALRHDAARTGRAGRGHQGARDLGAHAAGAVEAALDRQRVDGLRQVRQLVDDDLGCGGLHGAHHAVGVEGVADRRDDVRQPQGGDPLLAAGEDGDLVTGRDQTGDERTPDRPGAAGHEDAHGPRLGTVTWARPVPERVSGFGRMEG